MASPAGASRRAYWDHVGIHSSYCNADQVHLTSVEIAFGGWTLSDAVAMQEKCMELLRRPEIPIADVHEFLSVAWPSALGRAQVSTKPEESKVREVLASVNRVCEEGLDYMMMKQIRLQDVLDPVEISVWQNMPTEVLSSPMPLDQWRVIRKVCFYSRAKGRGEVPPFGDSFTYGKLRAVVNHMKTDFKEQFRERTAGPMSRYRPLGRLSDWQRWQRRQRRAVSGWRPQKEQK